MAIYNENTSISGTGNTTSRTNEITGDALATERRFICGYSEKVMNAGCIVDFASHNFLCRVDSQDKNTIHITDGMAFAYGYFAASEAVDFTILPPIVEQNFIVYFELNKSVVPNTCEVKIKNNYSSEAVGEYTLRKDELSKVKTGIYQIPLWQIKATNTGITTITDLRNLKYCIENVDKSNTAEMVIENGTIAAGVTIDAPPPFEPGDEKKSYVANTAFVINAIREEINRS